MKNRLRKVFTRRCGSSKEERAKFRQLGPHPGDPSEIRLYDRSIGDERILEIASSLRQNPHVKTLNLSRNCMGDDGAVALASSFLDNSVLERVTLGDNLFGAVGSSAIASALAHKECPIQALSLPQNAIGDHGVRGIAVSLESNVHLRELFLHSNRIGNVGAGYLANSLRKNSTLRALDLSDNFIGDDGLRALSDALIHNRSLKHLILGDNRFSAEGLRHLLRLVERNSTLLLLDAKAHLKGGSNEYQKLEAKISLNVMLNQCGRGLIRDDRVKGGLLPLILGRVSVKPDLLYGLLQDLPHLWNHSRS